MDYVRKQEIPIKIFGKEARITKLYPSSCGDKKFIVVVEFGKNPWNILSSHERIPAKNYSKKEFIKIVTKELKIRIEIDIENKNWQDVRRKNKEELKKLTHQVAQKLGIKAG